MFLNTPSRPSLKLKPTSKPTTPHLRRTPLSRRTLTLAEMSEALSKRRLSAPAPTAISPVTPGSTKRNSDLHAATDPPNPNRQLFSSTEATKMRGDSSGWRAINTEFQSRSSPSIRPKRSFAEMNTNNSDEESAPFFKNNRSILQNITTPQKKTSNSASGSGARRKPGEVTPGPFASGMGSLLDFPELDISSDDPLFTSVTEAPLQPDETVEFPDPEEEIFPEPFSETLPPVIVADEVEEADVTAQLELESDSRRLSDKAEPEKSESEKLELEGPEAEESEPEESKEPESEELQSEKSKLGKSPPSNTKLPVRPSPGKALRPLKARSRPVTTILKTAGRKRRLVTKESTVSFKDTSMDSIPAAKSPVSVDEADTEITADAPVRSESPDELEDQAPEDSKQGAQTDMSSSDYPFDAIIGHRPFGKDKNRFELQIRWQRHDPESACTWEPEEDLQLGAPSRYFAYWKSVGGREKAVEDPNMWFMFSLDSVRGIGRNQEFLVSWLGSKEKSWEPLSNVKSVASKLLEEFRQKEATKKKAAVEKPEAKKRGGQKPRRPASAATAGVNKRMARRGIAQKVKK